MNYHNITHDDMLNGEGLRTVLWVSGCIHACDGCHNRVTWDENSGIPFDGDAKEEIFDSLSKDYIAGITFSGGDPFYPGNRETILSLAKEIKEKFPDKTIWAYTGFTFDKVKDLEVINYLDVLVDGPFKKELLSPNKHWVGSSNQRIVDVKESMKEGHVVIKKD